MSKQEFQWPRGQSRYMVLADQLVGQIESGEYKPGDFLPAEAQLCEGFGVSRFTARQAIQEIKKRGLITTHHGIGSEVIQPKPSNGEFVFSFDSVDEFLTAAKDLKLEVAGASDEIADDYAAGILNAAVGAPYLLVHGRRVTKKTAEPVALVSLYIPDAYSGIRNLIGRRRDPVSRIIEAKYPVRTEQIHQTIEPIALDQKSAKSLGVPKHAPGLVICRTYVDATEGVFLHVRNIHAGKHAKMSLDIRRSTS